MSAVDIERRSQRDRDHLCIAIVPDLHCPYHDEDAVRAAQEFFHDLRPDAYVFLGDLFDFYDLSNFSKDPDRRFRLQEEFDSAREVVEGFVKGETRQRFLTYGNHGHRFQRYLRENAPELHSLRALDLDTLSGLKDLHFDTFEYGDGFRVGDLYFTHGDRVSKHSSYTAKRHWTDYGGSLAVAHSHRFGLYAKGTLDGTDYVYECGHLADPDPEYVKGVVNWQQGWAVAWVCPDTGQFWLEMVPYKDGRAVYRGRTYE